MKLNQIQDDNLLRITKMLFDVSRNATTAPCGIPISAKMLSGHCLLNLTGNISDILNKFSF